MTNTKAPQEIWFTITRKGVKRAMYYSRLAGRALPLPRAEAELKIATGEAIEVERPEWVGRR